MPKVPRIDAVKACAAPVDSPQPPTAVYVHVPFCLHRCGYCDFTLVASRDELIPAFLTAIANELATATRAWSVESIFIGGGTPTHLNPEQLDQLLGQVRTHFPLNAGGEFSIEANPDGLDDERLDVLVRHGINRLSLGVQSFDNEVLKILERRHTAEEAVECIQRSAEFIDNVSVDLIFGVPSQTVSSWSATLRQATLLPVRHISTYGLTFETGTDFTRRRRQGRLVALPDEIEREMYAAGIRQLAAAGFEHYEISNFAAPGFRCRHNQVYWDAREYFAFGPGAARYVNGVRSTNRRNVAAWIESWNRSELCLQHFEELTDEQRAREAIMLGLRLVDGFDLDSFEQRFGRTVEDLAGDALRRNLDTGQLAITDNRLHLTDEGRFLADSVVVDFL
ncbi:MAG: radical SAM family heme chaperone HemW [Planctomycetaceae bacterium]